MPPLGPASPSPEIRNLVFDSTPAGIFISNFLSSFILPSPLQLLQGVFIISPSPWHLGQLLEMLKKPVFVLILPEPPHSEHVALEVPGFTPLPLHVSQFSYLASLTVRFVPKAASSKDISILNCRLRPLRPLVPRLVDVPKISPRSKKSPNVLSPEKASLKALNASYKSIPPPTQ